ncbi:hypothetical protein ACFL6G_07630 [candidate division KSB1 bacterium]
MYSKFYFILLLFSFVVFAACQAQEKTKGQSDFPVLTGPYLGQKPPGLIPEIFAPGIVSTSDLEHSSPSFSPDGETVVWAAYSRPNKYMVIKIMNVREGRWTAPRVVSFSGECQDGGPIFSRDGSSIYFHSSRPVEGIGKPASFWSVERTENGWNLPSKIKSTINSGESQNYMDFAQEDTIYFSSNRKYSKGMADIYLAITIDGSYGEPTNLGEAINSKDSEFAPCVTPDQSCLIFSRYTESPKGVQLCISFRMSDGSWTKAVPMGDCNPLFRKARCSKFSRNGKYLFFCANVDGEHDIYWVDANIIESFKPETIK